jgi:hypothetical protein
MADHPQFPRLRFIERGKYAVDHPQTGEELAYGPKHDAMAFARAYGKAMRRAAIVATVALLLAAPAFAKGHHCSKKHPRPGCPPAGWVVAP